MEKEYIVEELQKALEKAENDGCIYAKIRRPIVFNTITLLKEQEAKNTPTAGTNNIPLKW